MDNFWHILFIWMHILGIALYVGPQVFLAFAWVPASRQIVDLPTRVAAMRTVTRRFGFIGGAGLVLIIVAGSFLIADWRSFYGIDDSVSFTSLRFGRIFIEKMSLFTLMLIAVGLHMFIVGPKLQRQMEEKAAGGRITDEEIRKTRMFSMILSISGLVLVLVIMVMGAMLGNPSYSLQES